MLYHIIKPIIKVALYFFCKNIYVNTKKYKTIKGPLLIAANHPNSFFDAVIIGLQLNKPVYFLARGDAFHKPWVHKILTALKCIPIYRIREGKQYLHRNEDSFERCREIFRKNGIVLIFSEGLCENTWQIRPLKKGTARLAFSAWKDPLIGQKLQILPVGVNYNSFRNLPKKVWVNFGKTITVKEFNLQETDGVLYQNFNDKIWEQWKSLVIDGIETNESTHHFFEQMVNQQHINNFTEINTLAHSNYFNSTSNIISKTDFKWLLPKNGSVLLKVIQFLFLFISSLPAIVYCYMPYKFIQSYVQKKAGKVVHYDSILFATLTLFFVIYLPFLTVLCFLLTKSFYHSLLFFNLLCISMFLLTKYYILCMQLFSHFKTKT